MSQIFHRPLKELRDNTEDIRSDLHHVSTEMDGLKDVLREMPRQIKSELVATEQIAHDAFVTGGIELGTLGLVTGLILGLFSAGALKK